MRLATVFAVLLLSLTALVSPADEGVVTDAVAENNIRQVLNTLLPDERVTRIRETPFNNVYEVLIGPNVIYISADGRYIFRGDMLDMQARENMSETERTLARKHIFSQMTADEYIEFSPEQAEHLIYVFTDIDCGYCRRLHRDVPVLNSEGVGVRYLAYPRGGVDSRAYELMQSVWCANDRKQALTDAKNGKQVDAKQCDNPVEEEYVLGQKFGVRGTPAIYTADGEELTGYLPPEELLKIVKSP